MQFRLILLTALGACASGTASQDRPDSGGSSPDAKVDAPGTPIDGPVDAPPTGSPVALLLTEVVLAPSTGEYVEIANPTDQPVDLAPYYLSDSGGYFRVPAGATIDATDFIVKFPAGAMIGPKGIITVALDTTANFTTVYGVAPTYSIASATMTSVVANGVATLTNGGELVVLFRWNGQDDVVGDVDILLAGVPSVANGLQDKSALALDGPDSDTTPTAYTSDARTITAQPTAPASGRSTKRVALETGNEVQTGNGNGVVGDDETTENTAVTWDTTFTLPTPGVLPAGLL